MRRFHKTWLILLALLALIGEPIAAEAHSSIDGDLGGICSAANRFTQGSQNKAPTHHQHQHGHDCCVALAAIATSGANQFQWQPDWLSFSSPSSFSSQPMPALDWQLQPARAPPLHLV